MQSAPARGFGMPDHPMEGESPHERRFEIAPRRRAELIGNGGK